MFEIFRKKQSTTLFFVTISWAVLTVKFAISGLTISFQGHSLAASAMSAGEYGAACLLILGLWIGREKLNSKKSETVAPLP